MGAKGQNFVVTARTLAFILGETKRQCRVLSRERVDLTYDLCPILKRSLWLLSGDKGKKQGDQLQELQESMQVMRVTQTSRTAVEWVRSGQILDIFQGKVRRVLWV